MHAPKMLQRCSADACQMLRDSFALPRKTTNGYSNHHFFALTTNITPTTPSHNAHFSVVQAPFYPFRHTIVTTPKTEHHAPQSHTP